MKKAILSENAINSIHIIKRVVLMSLAIAGFSMIVFSLVVIFISLLHFGAAEAYNMLTVY